ncbi:MAG: hypothetical protein L6R48_20130 [Planctomycetes bacterium]|nr:hypothetical protein [Planctomycetota bacterium]
MRAINRWLLDHDLRLDANPAVSPDWCLDEAGMLAALQAGSARMLTPSRLTLLGGTLELAEGPRGDRAWVAGGGATAAFPGGSDLPGGRRAWACTWERLLALKDLLLAEDPASTVFPSAAGGLDRRSLGVGARFTTLHWPAVEWAMAQLGLSMVANQNSIPRELVWDVDAMRDGRLDRVPFPFIGCDVPEGHQGQSVEGMSHGAVLSKLATGFHRRRIPWGFNADHQPVGGRFDAREVRLATGCLLASSITYDLSPELAATPAPRDAADARARAAEVPAPVVAHLRRRLDALGLCPPAAELDDLLARVWPAMVKFQRRDRAYAAVRERTFRVAAGRAYVRELSIDELPGLTSPATLAAMLALSEALEVRVHYVAPAFGFQKNHPFADQAELERRVQAAWRVCKAFDVSIGFHSGSGKSADNYRLVGAITGGRLEIKTSGRYTYEMGRALAASADPGDQALWRDWHAFTRHLAVAGAFATVPAQRDCARQFIADALRRAGRDPEAANASPEACAAALAALSPDPEHMFWFEYNFLFVLAAGGSAEPAALGDHSPAGYRQRARFYQVSPQARLGYLRNVADYLLFLAETTGLAPAAACAAARTRLAGYASAEALLADIAPG